MGSPALPTARGRRVVPAVLLVLTLLGAGTPTAGAAAPPSIILPIASFGSIAVDQTNGHVLITAPADSSVVVRNMDGSADTTITGVSWASQIRIDPAGTYAYVLEGTTAATSAVAQIDLSALTVTQTFPLGAPAACPDDLAFAGGLIWITYNHTNCSGVTDMHSGLASLDPATGAVAAHDETMGESNVLAASPDGNTLYTAVENQTPSSFARYDIGDPADPQRLTSSGGGFDCANLGEMSLSPDGSTLYFACAASSGFVSLNAADLSPQATYVATHYPFAVTTSADGNYVAGGANAGTPGIWIYKVGRAAAPLATFDLSQASIPRGGVAFAPDGSMLYAVTGFSPPIKLWTIANPTLAQPSLTISPAQAQVGPGAPVKLSGTLAFTDGLSESGIAVHVMRTNPGGSQTVLPDTTTGAGGSIAIADEPPLVSGAYTYVVSYDGDSTRASGEARTTVTMVLPVPALTLSASAGTVALGKTITLHAHLGPHGSTNDLALVSRRSNGTTSSRPITVDGNGNAVITVAPRIDTSYKVTFAGDQVDAPATSPSRTVDVRAKATGAMAGFYKTTRGYHLYHYERRCVSRAHRGCPAFATTVSPNNAGQRIRFRVQAFSGGAWRTALLGTVRLGARSTSGLIVFYRSRQVEGIRFRVRGEFLRSSLNLGATSGWQYFRVTG